jgi:hypothetical protein
MHSYKTLTAGMLALVLLTACGSSGMGDILGGGGGGSNNSQYEIRGTVESVDLNSRSMYLTNVSGYTSMLSNSGGGSGSAVRVYFDDQTSVEYQGRSYRPQDLERGDQVAVRVDESGNNLHADAVSVISDVSAGGNLPGGYESTLRGTVSYIDTSRRTITVDRGYGSTTTIEYETNTPVYFDGRSYRVADLERGDEIEIRTRDLGSGRIAATDITVTRNVGNSPSGSTSSNLSTVRGTVRYIDTSRRTIELESASYISGFNSGAGTGSTIVVSYSSNMGIDVNGTMQPLSGLERGDVIEVRGQRSGSTLVADRLWLVRDVRN